ncbi:MAG: hypothetical protein JKZ00_03840 [Flavobacteriaceae bacterium]|nr:hypothetical protein [Flavobacteriaceae bacterium]
MEPQKLQYETLIKVLAILGLPLCCCLGIGILPSGIAYFIARSELKKYADNPDGYDNQDSVYTGKIIALVVLIINVLYIAYTIYQINSIGFDVLMEKSKILMEGE